MKFAMIRRLAAIGSLSGTSLALFMWGFPKYQEYKKIKASERHVVLAKEHIDKAVQMQQLPTRHKQLDDLATVQYDVLVIGGGATGCGVALDAVSRGLKTALVEKFDFSSGTSSRSTKLIHGGVRYLQKAIFNLDLEQARMVKEALAERSNLIDIAPHLAYPLPIMLPVYKWWQLPYFYMGIKMYDLVAGTQLLKASYMLSKSKALELFPMLKKDKLVGAIVYYDGQHEDARMCIAIAMTAGRMGATLANHTQVTELHKRKDESGREVVDGARVKDMLTGKEFNVQAKCIVNATGPYTDFVRQKDNPDVKKICQPSSGVHVILPDYYSPAKMGLLDPATSDGRVIFFLPWQNHTMAGGKWTTYRHMAEETVDKAVEVCKLKPKNDCVTKGLLLEGAHGWTPTLFIRLIQDFGLDSEVAQHLSNTYGDRAYKVAKLAQLTGKRWPVVGRKLHEDYPYLEAEVLYAIREYACTAVDIIARRTRLAFLNVHAAEESIPRIIELMGRELNWSKERQQAELEHCTRFLQLEMGLNLKTESTAVPINFSKEEINTYISRFRSLDTDNKGYITVNDLRRYFKKIGEHVSEDQLHDILSEVDVNKNAQVDIGEFLQKVGERVPENQLHDMLAEVDLSKNAQVDVGEFLQLMSALKTGAVSVSRFARAAELNEQMAKPISIQRSGGGV
ncbi:hypothetical protein LSH36_1143g00045 [Paralvinella palmiformis]|uniref:Glycerol-3-phosphate dehydrogenase n=1 Tax=Paralvinella palmiformis TaxID=53620 RepID=A0AAD9IUF7_9ANNE|nr:hypothetical protein LSH36_1143g00045 [Paralvinella palmiformis]